MTDPVPFIVLDPATALQIQRSEFDDTKTAATDCRKKPSEKKCACGGPHPLKIVGDGVGAIQSYTGELPSPFMLAMLVPKEGVAKKATPSEIRGWAKAAAEYHEIPYEMLAVILQQENGPNAPLWRKIGQKVEREYTVTAAHIEERTGVLATIDEKTGILTKIKEITDRDIKDLPNGSTGILNMRRPTLLGTLKYTKEKYPNRPIIPSDKSNIDFGFAGDDWEADMYYGAAHIRQLIDRVVVGGGKSCAKGEITLEQVEKVFAAYNGKGDGANKYGKDAIAKLKGAYNGQMTLYFYE
jgi:hypothetical protein